MKPVFKKNIVGQRGFTLIEIMVAVSIFVMVAMITTGTLIMISSANRKLEAIKQGIDNMGFSLNSMAIRIREGSWPLDSLDRPTSGDCTDVFGPFHAFNNELTTYYKGELVGVTAPGKRCVVRDIDNGDKRTCLTDPNNIDVTLLKFCPLLYGGESNPFGKYKNAVAISLEGVVTGRTVNDKTVINLQTTVQMRGSEKI